MKMLHKDLVIADTFLKHFKLRQKLSHDHDHSVLNEVRHTYTALFTAYSCLLHLSDDHYGCHDSARMAASTSDLLHKDSMPALYVQSHHYLHWFKLSIQFLYFVFCCCNFSLSLCEFVCYLPNIETYTL